LGSTGQGSTQYFYLYIQSALKSLYFTMDALLLQFSKLLVIRRKELNIKQEELSDLTGIAIRTIRDLEKGKGNPSLETMEQLMRILGIELNFKLKK
jgi:DNA-binding XRE family transcriptional regulator